VLIELDSFDSICVLLCDSVETIFGVKSTLAPIKVRPTIPTANATGAPIEPNTEAVHPNDPNIPVAGTDTPDATCRERIECEQTIYRDNCSSIYSKCLEKLMITTPMITTLITHTITS
jgi:hypothetical protein